MNATPPDRFRGPSTSSRRVRQRAMARRRSRRRRRPTTRPIRTDRRRSFKLRHLVSAPPSSRSFGVGRGRCASFLICCSRAAPGLEILRAEMAQLHRFTSGVVCVSRTFVGRTVNCSTGARLAARPSLDESLHRAARSQIRHSFAMLRIMFRRAALLIVTLGILGCGEVPEPRSPAARDEGERVETRSSPRGSKAPRRSYAYGASTRSSSRSGGRRSTRSRR